MGVALGLARRALGQAWPNPAVGCVIVRDRRVVGRGWTGKGGRPHAERFALDAAGDAARGSTAYVTLEPCDHHGETPPCSQALVDAGIVRAVVAVRDADGRVDGKGIERLKGAGIDVVENVRAAAAADLNAGFFLRVQTGRPLFTLKVATTLDGRIATAAGESRWITGPRARDAAHLMRARHDAVMIGSGTALTDDPELTCRLPGLAARSPVRIVVDGRLRLTPSAKVIATAREVPTWVVTRARRPKSKRTVLAQAGAEIVIAPTDGTGHVDVAWLADYLGERGLTRVMVEGGGELAAAMLRRDLIDEIAWFRAPSVIGGDGIPAIAGLALADLAASPRFEHTGGRDVGADRLDTYKRRR